MNEVLYILMRNDLPSMNAGKAMAQASHASNQLTKTYGSTMSVKSWQEQTRNGFGTVLVLAGNKDQIGEAIMKARGASFMAELVSDPSYPYRADKELAALIPEKTDAIPRVENSNGFTLWRYEITCGYVFGDKEKLGEIVGHLPLHP
jgi:peptidyl-tRNA hydrolase